MLNIEKRESLHNTSTFSNEKRSIKEIRSNLIEMQAKNGEKLRETAMKVDALQS